MYAQQQTIKIIEAKQIECRENVESQNILIDLVEKLQLRNQLTHEKSEKMQHA